MKYKVSRLLRSSITVSVFIAIITVFVMPPMVPRHKMRLNNSFSAYNRLYAYYQQSDSTISDVSFLRTSKTSMDLEAVGHHVFTREGYTYDEYLKVYAPLQAPSRNDVCVQDIDADGVEDIFYITQERDSVFLVHSTVATPELKHYIFLTDKGCVYYSFVRFFYFSDGTVKFSLMVKSSLLQFHNYIYSYDVKQEKLDVVFALNRLFRGVQLKGVEDHLLLYSKYKRDVKFYNLNVRDKSCDTIQVEIDNFKTLYLSDNSEILPYSYEMDHLCYHNGDSLFWIDHDKWKQNEVCGHYIKSKKPKEKFSLKYSKNGVLFFTIYSKLESTLYKYDFEKRKAEKVRIKGRPLVKTILYYGDLDGNNKNEILFTDEKNAHESYCIAEEDRIYPSLCVYPVGRDDLRVGNSMREGNVVLFQGSGIERIVRYYENPEFYKHWLWCALIAIFIIIIGILVQKMQELRIYRKQQSKNKILQLQLENVQKRIDPHFIFNSLNNLGAMILEGKSNESYDYLSQVSGVLYKALRNRGILVTVDEELNFCSSVLETQRIRFKDRFDYDVYVEKKVDTKGLLPSNILNSMVDNCIKHGFSGINYTGMISIELLRLEEGVLVVVEDNGKGRKAAQADKDQKSSTGTGLDICHHYVTLFNQDRKTNRLFFKIIDLYEAEMPKGTRCEFYVPDGLELKENN